MAESVMIEGAMGQALAARLDRPSGDVRGWALFAHCFSCSKDVMAARTIARALSEMGIGVLRFDFTGLGHSEGDFADTNFSTNLADLEAAASWLAVHEAAPSLLVGHSLGGAAVVAVAHRLDHVKAVATIGAPSQADHVIENFGSKLDEIETVGEAEVLLAGRPFKIKHQFVEDVRGAKVTDAAANLRRPLLVMHAPTDEVVGIENATGLFVAAKHPKSFVSLDKADHLLSRASDARQAARVIAAWAEPYLPSLEPAASATEKALPIGLRVQETGGGRYENEVQVGAHKMIADEPVSVGGGDKGPNPYDFVSAGLGACTSMTLRMYAERKGWQVGRISVEVRHGKDYPTDCANCEKDKKVDIFERIISVEGALEPDQRDRLLEIADKCPVHRTIEHSSHIRTRLG